MPHSDQKAHTLYTNAHRQLTVLKASLEKWKKKFRRISPSCAALSGSPRGLYTMPCFAQIVSLAPHASQAPFSLGSRALGSSPACSLCWLFYPRCPPEPLPALLPPCCQGAGLCKLQHPGSLAFGFQPGSRQETRLVTVPQPANPSLATVLATKVFF